MPMRRPVPRTNAENVTGEACVARARMAFNVSVTRCSSLCQLPAVSSHPRADPEIGSFRRFLLILLKRFLAQERDAGHRRLEVSGEMAAERHHEQTPEHQFDLDFALCLTGVALDNLRDDYQASGRGELFTALMPLLSESPEHGELAALSAALKVAPNTLAVQLKRLRMRLQKAVRSALSELSLDAAHAAADLDALRRVLNSGEVIE